MCARYCSDQCAPYLAGALVLPPHHGPALPDRQLKVLQHGGQGRVGPARPLQPLLDAGLQVSQLLLKVKRERGCG